MRALIFYYSEEARLRRRFKWLRSKNGKINKIWRKRIDNIHSQLSDYTREEILKVMTQSSICGEKCLRCLDMGSTIVRLPEYIYESEHHCTPQTLLDQIRLEYDIVFSYLQEHSFPVISESLFSGPSVTHYRPQGTALEAFDEHTQFVLSDYYLSCIVQVRQWDGKWYWIDRNENNWITVRAVRIDEIILFLGGLSTLARK